MKKILLIGCDERLLESISDYGERVGGYSAKCATGDDWHKVDVHDLIIMDSLCEGVSPIDVIKVVAQMPAKPMLALLMNKDGAGERIQEAIFQYARAKGIHQATKLKVPLFLGDVQALLNRQKHIQGSPHASVPLQVNVDMLRDAIKQREFVVHFQPKIALKAGHIIGAESLVRWQHPVHGMIPPDAFIPLVEECGMMTEMTWLVLEESLSQVKEWRRIGYDFKVAVNFSASTFAIPGMTATVLSMIKDAHLDPDCLAIELTESAMVKNLDTLLESVLELYKHGVEIAIDDYGTGYSSLHQVSVIPASELKVDQSFVRDMLDNPVDHLIVRNTVRMAHSLGMRALAEGVETKRHALALARNGCDEAQGYFFSRPVVPSAFMAYAGSNPSREVSRFFNLQTQ